MYYLGAHRKCPGFRIRGAYTIIRLDSNRFVLTSLLEKLLVAFQLITLLIYFQSHHETENRQTFLFTSLSSFYSKESPIAWLKPFTPAQAVTSQSSPINGLGDKRSWNTHDIFPIIPSCVYSAPDSPAKVTDWLVTGCSADLVGICARAAKRHAEKNFEK